MTRAILATLALAAAVHAGTAAPLPTDDEIPGWRRGSVSRIYSGAELFGYINGGSEIFLELGFEELSVQEYRKGDAGFVVEAYEMTDAIAAEAIYLFKGGEDRITSVLPARHSVGRFQLQFQRDRFYVMVNSVSGDEGVVPDLLAFGRAMVSRLPEAPDHGLRSLLPPGWLPGSFRLLRGPLGLQGQVILGEGDLLGWTAAGITAAAADYSASGADGAVRICRVVARYPTPDDAAVALERVQAHLDEYLTPVSHSTRHLLFQDWQQRYGLITVEEGILELTVHWPSPPPVPDTVADGRDETYLPVPDDAAIN